MSETNAWAGLIRQYRLRSITQGEAHLEVLDPSLKSHTESARQRQELERFFSQAASTPIRLRVTVAEGALASSSHPGATIDPKLRAKAEQDPLVRRAMELFNARITDVQAIDPRPPAAE